MSWYLAGIQRQDAGDLPAAVEFFDAAVSASHSVTYRTALAMVLLDHGETSRARVHFEYLISLDPADHAAYANLARCLQDVDDARALEAIERAVALRPDLRFYRDLARNIKQSVGRE